MNIKEVEIEKLKEKTIILKDEWQKGKIIYIILDIVVVVILSVLADCNECEESEDYVKTKKDFYY